MPLFYFEILFGENTQSNPGRIWLHFIKNCGIEHMKEYATDVLRNC